HGRPAPMASPVPDLPLWAWHLIIAMQRHEELHGKEDTQALLEIADVLRENLKREESQRAAAVTTTCAPPWTSKTYTPAATTSMTWPSASPDSATPRTPHARPKNSSSYSVSGRPEPKSASAVSPTCGRP